MTEFVKRDLTGARFEEVDFSDTFFRNVYFVNATLRGTWLENVDIDGEIRGLHINGVDIGPLVEAELDRRHPERAKLNPTSADGVREAWALVTDAWAPTLERARRLPPESVHERVDDEWSFVETLRHLVFVADAWGLRAMLGREKPYSPLGLPTTEHDPDDPDVPNDPDLRPSLVEVLEVRAERMRVLGEVVAGLTDDTLAGEVTVAEPGYPKPGTYAVRRSLRTIVNEEWLHRQYAERDLAVLEQRLRGAGDG